jgi:hypothetical protein
MQCPGYSFHLRFEDLGGGRSRRLDRSGNRGTELFCEVLGKGGNTGRCPAGKNPVDGLGAADSPLPRHRNCRDRALAVLIPCCYTISCHPLALWVQVDSIRSGCSLHLSYRLGRFFCLNHFHGPDRFLDHPKCHRPIISFFEILASENSTDFAHFTKSCIFPKLTPIAFRIFTCDGNIPRIQSS